MRFKVGGGQEARSKAIAGIRQRKINKSTKKKIFGMAGQLR